MDRRVVICTYCTYKYVNNNLYINYINQLNIIRKPFIPNRMVFPGGYNAIEGGPTEPL